MCYERYKSNMFYLIIAILLPIGSFTLNILGINQNMIEILYMYLFILVPSILFIIIDKKNIKDVLRLNKVSSQQVFISMLIVLALQPITAFVGQIAYKLLGDAIYPSDLMQVGGSNISIFMSLFIIAVTPAICEEVLMRGVILNGYRKIPLWKVALMNGVLFGLFHNNFMQLSYTTVVGIVLTYVVVITNSIFPAMFMHFIINGLSVLIENYPNSIYSNFTYWYESNFLITFILAVICTIAVVLLIIWLKKASSSIIKEELNSEANNNENEIDNKSSIAFVEWPLILASIISIIYSVYR